MWGDWQLGKPFGRGVGFQWDIAKVDNFHSEINTKSASSIYLEIKRKAYQRATEVIARIDFSAQDPDSFLLRSVEII